MSTPALPTATQAQDRAQSPFDFIIVGSGAGGGPLACRLAEAGRRVLLLEAGGDPMLARSAAYPNAAPGEVTQAPGYYAAASEDAELSWMFSVRHCADDERQKRDAKYNQIPLDPSRPPDSTAPLDPKYLDPHPRNGGRQGIFYPRGSGLGGCTAHHAMIVIAPNDKDWNAIADLTGDESWRAGRMRGYFAKLERCLYVEKYNQFFRQFLGLLYRAWRWTILLLDPRALLDHGGHGAKGWQPTSLIDPFLVHAIAEKDQGLFRVIVRSALSVLHGNRPLLGRILAAVLRMRVVQQIDFNDVNTRRATPEGVFFIPIGTESGTTEDEKKQIMTGWRAGVREFLLGTAAKYPDRLVIESGFHVTRVLFEKSGDGVPRAIGVEGRKGDHLYEASPRQQNAAADSKVMRLFTRGEVLLCGGAFNTPQLLMLSGLGDTAHLARHGITHLRGAEGEPLAEAIHLPGIGRNLQDRYEVTVVSELNEELATLRGVSFQPGDAADPEREKWLKERAGLYTTNGGTLAVIRRSSGAVERGEAEADLFTFGAPAAFRGYYWNWSRELFRPALGATTEQRKLWSWVILKAGTRNEGGTVRLRSANAFDMPEICFDSFNEQAELAAARIAAEIAACVVAGRPIPAELAARRAANDGALAQSQRDLDALVDAVGFMRRVNACNREQFVREIQPGADRTDGSEALREWIKTQAWGHHACGTCRLGSDPWQADARQRRDEGAVLDSQFRVHGVRGLRVVDASVFPQIPGYFIVAPIFMVSEKAADTILADRAEYPAELSAREAAAIRERRRIARAPTPGAGGRAEELPPETVGLALSGGGIRSATYALGVLQALAEKGRLRSVDLLSTVSGGAFTGSFLGRLFTRPVVTEAHDPVGRVEEILRDSRSGPLWWLRTQANYIFGSGATDVRQNLAIFWRNLFTVHLIVGALLFAAFAAARGGSAWLPAALAQPPAGVALRGVVISAWWWLPLAVLALGVLPGALGYWLAPRPGATRTHPFFSLLSWLVLLGGAGGAVFLPGGVPYAAAGLGVLLLAWVWQEAARWGTDPASGHPGVVVRNRLTRGLGEAVTLFALAIGWVLLDTAARTVAGRGVSATLAVLVAVLGPFLPLLRLLGETAARQLSGKDGARFSATQLAQLPGLPLAAFLLLVVDVFAHELFDRHPGWGLPVFLLAIVFSAAVGRALEFLNLSSFHAAYAARLTRTFQGASNAARIYTAANNAAHDVQLAHPADDLPLHRYHPERHGCPLHLISVCVNETVDVASDRDIRERQGLSMCLGPEGVSVGTRQHAVWAPATQLPWWQRFQRWLEGLDHVAGAPPPGLDPLLPSHDPNAFHVLGRRGGGVAPVERLSLGAWVGISGAAFSTGLGRATTLPLALLFGIVNLRLGYWWNSGIPAAQRPGRYPQPLWRRLKHTFEYLFPMQSLLLAEWRARFAGPSRRYWYLTDGGHFENTGLYELLRRRVAFMIVTDAGQDPRYWWEDLAGLTRKARMDFGVELAWVEPAEPRRAGWAAIPDAPPEWIRKWIQPDTLGGLRDIGPFAPDGSRRQTPTRHAALARVTYSSGPEESWILLLKPSLSGDETRDLDNYARNHPTFPQETTADQFFDDAQWESYRALGQQTGRHVLASVAPVLAACALLFTAGCQSHSVRLNAKQREVAAQLRTIVPAQDALAQRQRIIDVHTHTFNGRYLPLKNILLGKRDAAPPWSWLISDRCAGTLAAALVARTELAPAPGQAGVTRRGRGLLPFDPRVHGPVCNIILHLLNKAADAGCWDERLSPAAQMQQVEKVATRMTLLERQSLRTATRMMGMEEPLTTADPQAAIKAAARFLWMLTQNDAAMTDLYTGAYRGAPMRGAPLMISHLMDLGPVYNQPAEGTAFLDFGQAQVRRAEAYQRRPEAGLIYFVAYNPFRASEALPLVRSAVEKRGAWGVKVYPPSGYRAAGNEVERRPRALLTPHPGWQWDARYAALGKDQNATLNGRLEELLEWCIVKDIPVFAHSGTGEFEARKGYGLHHSNPSFWRRFLESHPAPGGSPCPLRLCLGHAGGDDFWVGGGRHASWGEEVFDLCREFPNVYCEITTHADLVDANKQAWFVDRLTRLFAQPLGSTIPGHRHPSRHPFSGKLLYGTDWYLPAAADRRDILRATQQAFLHQDLRTHYDAYFRGNALEFLNVRARLHDSDHPLPPEVRRRMRAWLAR